MYRHAVYRSAIYGKAAAAAQDAFTSLFVGLGAVALLVGGVRIANVMFVSVLERCSEIGLRRALGATRLLVGVQFLAESLLLSLLVGVGGVLLGAAATAAYALALGLRPWCRRWPWRDSRRSRGRGRVPYPDVAKLAIMIEGQEGVDWRLWKHLAETVEGLGFDSFWRSDHLYSVMGEFDRATIECWTSLALIATWTKRIPFGPNVSPMTFREPGVLAKAAAAVDLLSEGRLVMGVGAGWYEAEHRDFGIPFPPLKERMDRMDASFDVMRGVWEARNPRPVRGTIPFLVGGDGERRTLRAVARHADWWSIGIHRTPDEYRHKVEVLEGHCREIGRDPREIRRGFQTIFLVGRTEEDLLRRADGLRTAIPRFHDLSPEQVLATVREQNFGGTPAEIAARMRPYVELGVDVFWMQHFLFEDDEALRLLTDEVAPLIA